MLIHQAKKHLIRCIDTDIACMMHGSVGIGKSDIVRQTARDQKLELMDIRLSQYESVDLRGVPNIKSDLTVWNPPATLPRKGKGILFLDEINSAQQSVQAAAYQLILDRKLGDYELPSGWRIFAAGNRLHDGAIVNKMSTALKNRFSHINVTTDIDNWSKWAILNAINSKLIAFLRFRPALLNELDDDVSPTTAQKVRLQNAFATPRTWHMLSKLMYPDDNIAETMQLAISTVGEGPANELQGFLSHYADLPTVDEVIDDPKHAKLPSSMGAIYAITVALSTTVTKATFGKVFTYIKRSSEEFQTMFLKDLNSKDPKILIGNKDYNEWTVENSSLILPG